jgi:type II secretory pathway pseudopilin PulG
MRARERLRQSGFTYLGLMAAIVILGILLTMASRVWSFSEQRDKEAQLLWVGDQFRLAIAHYYTFDHHYPLTLQVLLLDDSSPVPLHHLRQLYRDPITGEADWTLIMDPNGAGILGVASKSKLAPIKRKGFADIEAGFAEKDCYCDWKFIYVPRIDPYHRYTAPGQGQFMLPALPAPLAPPLAPACDPSVADCTAPPNTPPPNQPPRILPTTPPRTH